MVGMVFVVLLSAVVAHDLLGGLDAFGVETYV